MYMYAERYISSTDTFDEQDPQKYKQILEIANMDNLPKGDLSNIYVKTQVGYWRKANAIHGWLIRNCADNIDNCEEFVIQPEQLIQLRDECVLALANRHNATKPIEADYVHKMKDGEDILKVIEKSMKRQSDRASKKGNVADPLEPIEGFFFGSSEKDEYYYKDLEYTVELINALLPNIKSYSIIYRASW